MTSSILKNKLYNASITVEAAMSFSFTIFILFLMLGPIFILKSSVDITLKLDKTLDKMNYYTLIKYNVENTIKNDDEKKNINDQLKPIESVENLSNHSIIIANILNIFKKEKNVFDNILVIIPTIYDVYDDSTGIINYDYDVYFNLPFNIFDIKIPTGQFVAYRRAFIGVDGDRFNKEKENYVYVARNHIYSNIYHIRINCSYLTKETEEVTLKNIDMKTNADGKNYVMCSLCFKNIHYDENTKCYITKYGINYHYNKNCKKGLDAYITKELETDMVEKGLTHCSRCKNNKNVD